VTSVGQDMSVIQWKLTRTGYEMKRAQRPLESELAARGRGQTNQNLYSVSGMDVAGQSEARALNQIDDSCIEEGEREMRRLKVRTCVHAYIHTYTHVCMHVYKHKKSDARALNQIDDSCIEEGEREMRRLKVRTCVTYIHACMHACT
jgi:hypothetical protein